MQDLVTIALDAQGGDGGAAPNLEGARMALQEDPTLQLLLCGQKEVIEPFASTHERCEVLETGAPILMGEHPAQAVKAKKDSSIVLGCKAVKDGRAQGFFSAGSTGACLVAATLYIGRIKGVKRPALGTMIPTIGHPTFVLDVGANSDCKVDYLIQFAKMGSIYVNKIRGVANPRIGLLNIGEEESKGSTFVQEAHAALAGSIDGFAGNCESKMVLNGDYDVVVTDGFTGNIFLKTIEATAQMMFRMVKGALTSSTKAKLGALLVKKPLGSLRTELNPDTFGGSPLLGVDGVCLIGHGSSNSTAIKNGILAAAREVRANIASDIFEALNGHASGAASAMEAVAADMKSTTEPAS